MTWEDLLKKASEPPRKKPSHNEDKLQIQCVRWFTLQYPRLAALLHHSPNGGARSRTEGARFKQMGVRAGFPDLFLYHPNNVYHGLAVELKTHEKGSRQSTVQEQWEARLKAEGYQYVVCRDLEEFMHTVNSYLSN